MLKMPEVMLGPGAEERNPERAHQMYGIIKFTFPRAPCSPLQVGRLQRW